MLMSSTFRTLLGTPKTNQVSLRHLAAARKTGLQNFLFAVGTSRSYPLQHIKCRLVRVAACLCTNWAIGSIFSEFAPSISMMRRRTNCWGMMASYRRRCLKTKTPTGSLVGASRKQILSCLVTEFQNSVSCTVLLCCTARYTFVDRVSRVASPLTSTCSYLRPENASINGS
jgi:hypothetical protein